MVLFVLDNASYRINERSEDFGKEEWSKGNYEFHTHSLIFIKMLWLLLVKIYLAWQNALDLRGSSFVECILKLLGS